MKKLTRLDAVCKIVMGQAPDGAAYNETGEGLPLIAGAGDFGAIYPLAKKFTSKITRTSEVGDIILGIRATIGEKVLADAEYCLGRGVSGLRPGPKLDVRFLWHWLTHIQPELSRKAKGATFKQVNKNDIGELEIDLPPVAEQRRIAAILDKADALRARRREALICVDALTRSIFLEMFGDPIQNQKGWPTAKLSEIGRLDRGVSKHRPRNAPELLGGVYPLIQTGDVANCDGYIRTYASTYSEIGLKQSRLWPKGTLCITIAANIAKTGIIRFDACFPDSVVGFSAVDAGTVEYVRVWLSFVQRSLEDLAPESAQKNIKLAVLRDLVIPLPPITRRSEFLLRLRRHERVRADLRCSLTQIDRLFTSLQHRAFSGTL